MIEQKGTAFLLYLVHPFYPVIFLTQRWGDERRGDERRGDES